MDSQKFDRTSPPVELAQAISRVIDAHQEAWNTHNVQAYVGLFAEDGELVNVVGMHRRGKKELEAEFSYLHSTIMRNSRIRILDRSVRALAPGVALAHSTWDMTGVDRVPGWNVPDVRRGIFTYVLVESDGKWLITAAHNTEVLPLPDPTKSEQG